MLRRTQGARPGSDEPGWAEPDHHAIGRSRGGLTTKLHLLTDGQGRPLVLLLTPGNVNDCPTFPQLIAGLRVAKPGPGRPRTRPNHVLGDKGYSSRANRELLRRRGIPHTIPEPRDQQANRARRGSRGGRPVGFDKKRYQRRNVVERGFNQLKAWRGIASRTDKHAINYRGGITFRATLAWIS
ncbi:hypothetical protein GCM10023203_61240 [Actinomycetospora straminea]|uniref:Transposase IS4-like domain-containing protein n=1 Tax=Actinomycetospora straminea TaxID=663607 RepID=A0ABP9FF37_9PSEU